MSTRPEITFDPYGEPVEPGRSGAAAPVEHRARNAAVAVFWALALLLIAGRVYLSGPLAGQAVASPQEQAPHLVTAAR